MITDIGTMLNSNMFVASAIAKPCVGLGTRENPLIFDGSSIASGGTRNEVFRKHLFEALLHASVKKDLTCYFIFREWEEVLYEMKLSELPNLTAGAAVDFARSLMETGMIPSRQDVVILQGITIYINLIERGVHYQ